MSPAQAFAVFARMLCRLGYDDGLAGHITLRQPDGALLTNPFLIAWDQIRASDVATCGPDGAQTGGPYKINPATSLHFALHRLRPAEVIAFEFPAAVAPFVEVMELNARTTWLADTVFEAAVDWDGRTEPVRHLPKRPGW